MIRKAFFWVHLSIGVVVGLFIFIMAATGVILSFERQITAFIDRDVRFVSAPNEGEPRRITDLLESVRRSGVGDPTAISITNEPQSATQFSIGRGKTVYVDPYSGAILGPSSSSAHDFFFTVERWHRALGAPLAKNSPARRVVGVSNLLFGVLILLGIVLWFPRKWTGKSIRAVIAFRSGLRGRARDWNWHHVVGIWCALPLLVIVLTGMVMSFDWANALLFRLSGSPPPASAREGGDRRPHFANSEPSKDPDYETLLARAKTLQPDWRTITLNVAHDAHGPVSAVIDTGTGGQPQNRTQYTLNRDSGAAIKTVTFSNGTLGQRLRAFVRFGHTGEFGGLIGQAIAAVASLGACLLIYTGLALTSRRFLATLKRRRADPALSRTATEQSLV